MSDKQLLGALLRQDFYLFVQRVFREIAPGEDLEVGWALEAMCHVLTEVASGARQRQTIEIAPRSLKSVIASVAFPAWILGRDPTNKIIAVSYAQKLADQHSAMCRQVMMSGWYQELFPRTRLSPSKNTESYFRTTAGGYRDSTSVGGTLTGKGGNLIIIDDPLKPDDAYSETLRTSANEWFGRTLLSRLNNKARDAILIVMQRLHPEDLVGHVTQQDQWQRLIIPAIGTEAETIEVGPGRFYHRAENEVLFPLREPLHVLMGQKAGMGSRAFESQYQQNPVPDDGAIVEWAWFRRYGVAPERPRARIVQSWDCASKDTEFADYSVCTTWAVIGQEYFLLDLDRAKLNFPQLLQRARDLGERWIPNEVLIEDAAAGIQLIQQLRFQRPIRMPSPTAITPDRDKVTRLHGVSATVEQGRVYLPQSAAWLEDFRLELIQFPTGKHDDQVDSMAQFLGREERKRQLGATVESRPLFA